MRGVEWVPHMSHIRGSHLFSLIGILALATLVATPSFAETPTLISIGPRVGFSEKTPLLGKQQKYFFHLTDVAAHFRLPWSWPLGGNSWNLETRLITSAGLLEAASDSALMVTIVPDLALSVWEGLVTFDAGAGAGFFSNYKFGTQDFGGPVQIVATLGGSRQSIFSRLCRFPSPTLLRCRRVRPVQSRCGPVYRRARLQFLRHRST
jgi:hypothetical protein